MSSAPAPDRGGVPLTDGDREILHFVGEHRLVLERQLVRLTGRSGTDLADRLSSLVAARYLSNGRVFGETHYQIRKLGLGAIGSPLKAPHPKLATYRHDIGVAWLWLAARAGTFGPLHEVIGERRLRSHDGAFDRPAEPYGVRLGGFDLYGNERLHYPDLLLIDSRGQRLALELELSSKGRERRTLILGAYAADSRVSRVLYLVEANPAGRGIRRSIEGAAWEMRLTDRVRFQFIKEIRVGSVGEARATVRTPPARRLEATR